MKYKFYSFLSLEVYVWKLTWMEIYPIWQHNFLDIDD